MKIDEYPECEHTSLTIWQLQLRQLLKVGVFGGYRDPERAVQYHVEAEGLTE